MTNKKIIAIGGGENGRVKSDGTRYPYELENQDREIIRLTKKEHPNFLFIAHSQPIEKQEGYFQVMIDIYEKMYGCHCRDLKSDKLTDIEYVRKLIDWADIIFEGGGNTLDMINLWKETGFDVILRQAWEDGKVMCGISAGANCWFKECSSDSLKIKYGDDQPLIDMECLGFVDGLFVPHCDAPERLDNVKELLMSSKQVGLCISNCAALEIVDNRYRLITSDASYHNIEAYGLKSYWKNKEYIEEKIDDSLEFKSLGELLSKK
ncbi:MAG: type 1 glutamine amidotransferase-like domain-containing protein [Clostridia bacterium]|nr:type 1 glutamine amidotransferase-like domain-containing protein [Clostridia bacterium]